MVGDNHRRGKAVMAPLSASLLHTEGSQAEESIAPSFMCVSDLCDCLSKMFRLSKYGIYAGRIVCEPVVC